MPEHTPAPTPHRAIYGYAFYLLVIALFVFYFLWALLPTKEWGLTYLPDKYFAVLLPMLVLVGLSFFAFFIYPAISMSLTADIDEMASVADVSLILKGKQKKIVRSWSELQQEMVPNRKASKNSGNLIENCYYCLGSHSIPKVADQIDTLRFMDLAEVNKKLFE
ncbi:phosphatidylinositol N-acetylglucosaminyltransferase subunit P [Calliphora vicina]|uniref:phosphatidylinositol N-acetylglucosaminyltransferase subunit P n=1 Tax=Calliphora vicina TaxID=7373 RepID=UPI00325BA6DA